jgi:hypothetical protein
VSNYVRVAPRPRRRVPWLGIVWLAGATGVTVRWAIQPEVPAVAIPVVVAGNLLALGAALAGRRL